MYHERLHPHMPFFISLFCSALLCFRALFMYTSFRTESLTFIQSVMISIVIASFCIGFCWSHRDDFVDWDGGLLTIWSFSTNWVGGLIFLNSLFLLNSQYAWNKSECLHVCIELSHCLHPIDDGSDFHYLTISTESTLPSCHTFFFLLLTIVSFYDFAVLTNNHNCVGSFHSYIFYKCFALNKGW